MRNHGGWARKIAVLLAVAVFATSFHAWNLTGYAAEDFPAPVIEDEGNKEDVTEDAGRSDDDKTGDDKSNDGITQDDVTDEGESPDDGSATPSDHTFFTDETEDAQSLLLQPEENNSPTENNIPPDDSAPPLDDVEIIREEEEETVSTPELADADILYEDYFNRIMYPAVQQPSQPKLFAKMRAVPRYSFLTEGEKLLYDFLKGEVTKIANGERKSARITFFLEDILKKTTFTYEELGVDNGTDAKAALKELLPTKEHRVTVMRTLMLDVPYELYWFDKDGGGYMHAMVNEYELQPDNEERTVSIVYYGARPYGYYNMCVSADYSRTGDAMTTDLNTAKTKATNDAADNAKSIVNAAKKLATDYNRVCYYKDVICELTAYNHDAVDSGKLYGDPWQLVYVFDNDPATDVVCEGYAKAFKYLCDLTEFDDEEMEAHIVQGLMSSESTSGDSNHMWNIMRMDDGNYYHVDITNCDADLPDDFLFLKGYLERVDGAGEKAAGFRYLQGDGTENYYIYDTEWTTPYFTAAELEMSPSDYEPLGWITLTLDMGDGTVFTKRVARTHAYGSLPDAPAVAGYTFEGWYTAAHGGVRITETGLVSAAANNQTLYPRYAPVSYTVTFDLNGKGGFAPSDAPSKTVLFDTLYGRLPVPEQTDMESFYSFKGWYTAETGGERITEDTIVEVTGDHTLYARWETDTELEIAKKLADRTGSHPMEQIGLWLYGIQEKDLSIGNKYKYTGAQVRVDPTYSVYFKNQRLTEGRDYTVSYRYNVNAAKYNAKNAPAIVIRGKGNYAGTITHPFEIHPADIADAKVTIPLDGVTDEYGEPVANVTLAYNRRVQKPGIKVVSTLSGRAVTLSAGRDYTIAYNEARRIEKDPVTNLWKDTDLPGDFREIKLPGFYRVPIYGKGNYGPDYDEEDTLLCESKRYMIVEVVATTQAAVDETMATKKQTLMPSVTIPAIPAQTYANGDAFVYGTVKTGETALQNAQGTADFEWKLYDRAARHYLVSGTDYRLVFQNNSAVGTATVTITGMGDYAGSVVRTFAIKGKPMSGTNPVFVKPSAANEWWNGTQIVYTGEEIKPAGEAGLTTAGENGCWTLTDPRTKTPLTNGVDYDVTYLNNVNTGTATIVFTGKNAFAGTSVRRTFRITAYNMKTDPEGRLNVRLAQSALVYRKGGVKPEPVVSYTFNGKRTTLKAGVHYTLRYANNTVANGTRTPTVTITGKGCFAGARDPLVFTILPADIGLYATVSASDVVYRKSANICRPAVVLTDKKNGINLVAGTDYVKTFAYTYTADTIVDRAGGVTAFRAAGDPVDPGDIIPAKTVIKVTVTGRGNYTGTAEGMFRFAEASIAGAVFTIANQAYTGNRILITNRTQFTNARITIGRVTTQLELGTDFEVVGYSNNTETGTAKVTLRGIEAAGYGGTKTVAFKIVQKSMNYTVKYDNNLAYIKSYLKNEYGLDETKLDARFKVTGAMTDSLTTEGGVLKRNTIRIYDKELGAYLTFLGWNKNPDGTSDMSYKDGGVFDPGRQAWYRKFFGITHTLYAQWDLTGQAFDGAKQSLKSVTTVPWNKVVCIGDKLTEWGYPYHLEKLLKPVNPGLTVVNKGIHGATINTAYREADYEQRILEIIDGFDATVTDGTDAVFLMAGTVDWLSQLEAFNKYNYKIGDAATPGTFSYDFNLICKKMKSKFPAGTKVYIVMPLAAIPNGNRPIEEFRKAEKTIANAHGFTVIDNHVESGIFNTTSAAVKKKYYTNSVLLTSAGYDVLAAMIAEEALGTP